MNYQEPHIVILQAWSNCVDRNKLGWHQVRVTSHAGCGCHGNVKPACLSISATVGLLISIRSLQWRAVILLHHSQFYAVVRLAA